MKRDLPPLFFSSDQENKRRKELDFLAWDNALEEMLSNPITPELNQKTVKWHPRTVFADSIIGMNNEGNIYKPSTAQEIKNRDVNVTKREVMIRNMILAPLSPRKKQEKKVRRVKSKYNTNNNSLEVVMAQRMKYNFDDLAAPARKSTIRQVARAFSIPLRQYSIDSRIKFS